MRWSYAENRTIFDIFMNRKWSDDLQKCKSEVRIFGGFPTDFWQFSRGYLGNLQVSAKGIWGIHGFWGRGRELCCLITRTLRNERESTKIRKIENLLGMLRFPANPSPSLPPFVSPFSLSSFFPCLRGLILKTCTFRAPTWTISSLITGFIRDKGPLPNDDVYTLAPTPTCLMPEIHPITSENMLPVDFSHNYQTSIPFYRDSIVSHLSATRLISTRENSMSCTLKVPQLFLFLQAPTMEGSVHNHNTIPT